MAEIDELTETMKNLTASASENLSLYQTSVLVQNKEAEELVRMRAHVILDAMLDTLHRSVCISLENLK